MFEAMAFKNYNKASWLPAALENEKNEAVSGESKGPVEHCGARRGQTVGAASFGAGELIYNG